MAKFMYNIKKTNKWKRHQTFLHKNIKVWTLEKSECETEIKKKSYVGDKTRDENTWMCTTWRVKKKVKVVAEKRVNEKKKRVQFKRNSGRKIF